MNKRQAKIEAVRRIWCFADYLSEDVVDGLSDNLLGDVYDGTITEKDARKIQKALKYEADIIFKKLTRLKQNSA